MKSITVIARSITAIAILLVSFPAHADWVWHGPFFEPPPLNTPNMWARQEGPISCPGCTGNILALIWDTKALGAESLYPWPLYVQLTTDQAGGDATAVNARLYQDQAGGWGAVYHGEPFARREGNTLLGVNIEPHNLSNTSRVIGFNANAKEGASETAFNVMADGGSWKTGLALNGHSIDFGGGRALKLDPRNRLCIFNSVGRKVRCLTGPIR